MKSRRTFIKTSALLSAGIMIRPTEWPSLAAAEAPIKLKPKALKAGDTIAVTSPAGAVWDTKQIEQFQLILKGLGFKVVLGKTLSTKFGYLAGDDYLRAEELNSFFKNEEIKGIFSMKGGWGCARLLDKLDYNSIKANPKVLIGFSDITTLLNVIYAKTGLVTFHGPVGNSGWNNYTKKVFNDVIVNAKAVHYPSGPEPEDTIITLSSGTAEGELTGGNLSVLAGIVGSGYLPDWKGKLLFLEEAKEEPYRIDRMLTQLKLAGILTQLSGIIFGKCVKCEAEEPEKAFTFMQVIEQHIKPLNIPAFYGAMTGHIENKWTIPIGVKAQMDAENGVLKLLEKSVV